MPSDAAWTKFSPCFALPIGEADGAADHC